MNLSEQELIERVSRAGDAIDVPPVDLPDVRRRAAARRRTRWLEVAGCLTVVAALLVTTVIVRHSDSRPAPVTAAPATTNPLPGLARPACVHSPAITVTPWGDVRVREVSEAHPLVYRMTGKDAPDATLTSGTLTMSVAGAPASSYWDPVAKREVVEPAAAKASMVKLADGTWAGTLRITSLAPGTYPLTLVATSLGSACLGVVKEWASRLQVGRAIVG